jgi:hypothetical protein
LPSSSSSLEPTEQLAALGAELGPPVEGAAVAGQQHLVADVGCLAQRGLISHPEQRLLPNASWGDVIARASQELVTTNRAAEGA